MPVGKMMKCVQRNAVTPPGAFTSGGFYSVLAGWFNPLADCLFAFFSDLWYTPF